MTTENNEKKTESGTPTEQKVASVKLSRLEIDVLQYFNQLPLNRQKELIDEHKIDFSKFATAVTAHRRAALTDDELAVEKMIAQQAPSKSGEKMSLLENRYRASIERFAKQGVTPVMIASHLTDVERKNYPKRPKAWKFTPAMLAKFMKENDIEVVKK